MKQKSGLHIAVMISYAVLVSLLLFFAVYMSIFEHNTVYSARQTGQSCHTVENYTLREVADPSAPAGIRKEYRWTMTDIGTGENSLAFYLVHQYVEVRFDGELMYSLTPGKDNRIGGSPGSNWVLIPIYPSDSGREVQVTVTPVYQSVANREIQFEIGPRASVLMSRLKADFPQIILSVLCILLGIVIMLAQIYLILRKQTSSWDVFYLGNFSLLVGIWRITDTRFSPLLFADNPMALGYITIGALFMSCIPLLLFMKDHYEGGKKKALLITALANCAVAALILACQVFGLAEFRETLFSCHIMMIADIAVLLLLPLIPGHRKTNDGVSSKLMILLAIGALADLVYFYLNGTSSNVLFTISMLLIYTVLRFAISVFHIKQKAYTDSLTGLPNKRRWDELMEDNSSASEPIGIMMLDLNCLKSTNDTLGHEAGNKMLFDFANILHNTIPFSNTICRYGGDEFAVMITHADRDKMENCISAISEAVNTYNASGENPAIYFAAGYALSSDLPSLSRKELLEKADARMYKSKQQWHAQNDPGR